MINLLLSALFSIFIANLLKLVSGKKISILYVFLGNYICASVIGYTSIDVQKIHTFINFDSLLAIGLGIFFVLNLILYYRNIDKNGVSLTVSIMRISLILPVLLSVLIFKETLNIYTISAIILILIIISLLTHVQKNTNLLLIIVLFIITGFTEFFMKIHEQMSMIKDNLFLLIVFISSMFSTFMIIVLKKEKICYKSLLIGLLLGIPNFLTSLFFIKALNQLPAVVCYPLSSSLVLLGSFLCYVGIWKTRFRWYQISLYLSLIIAVILLNAGMYK